jgi:hypothetical protein
VRETIFRPLLHDLGYWQGTPANIETEKTLRYDRMSLGRKKPTDPPLTGRADYVCTVVGVASWIGEAKGPGEPITQEDVEQAHSYARHPAINGQYMLLMNGVEVRLYQASNIESPLATFGVDEIPSRLPSLISILGPEAIRQRFARPFSPSEQSLKEIGSGIGRGLGPAGRAMGGFVEYTEHDATGGTTQQILDEYGIGARGIVTGGAVYRLPGGQIRADIKITQPNKKQDALARLMNLEWFKLQSSDEYISRNPEAPTIFTGQTTGGMPAGQDVTGVPGMQPGTRLQIAMHFVADLRATGWLEGSSFKGQIWYRITYAPELPQWLVDLQSAMGTTSSEPMAYAMWGEVTIELASIAQSELAQHTAPS